MKKTIFIFVLTVLLLPLSVARALTYEEIRENQGQVKAAVVYTPLTLTSPLNRSLKLSVLALSFENSQWRYSVNWDRTLRERTGSVYITPKTDRNAVVFKQDNAQGQGEGFFNLRPGTRYRVEFYSRPNAQGVLLLRKYFNSLSEPVGNDAASRGGPEIFESQLSPKVIDVVSPAGGEQWTVGSRQTAQWTASSTVTAVNIELNTQTYSCPGIISGGQSRPCVTSLVQPIPIARNIQASLGSYSFTVALTTPYGNNNYVVKISDANNPGNYGLSEPVTILAALSEPADPQIPVQCTMELKICPDGSGVARTGPNCEFAPCLPTGAVISSPAAGESWPLNSRQTIRWSLSSAIQQTTIKLQAQFTPPCGNSANPNCIQVLPDYIVAANIPNTGSYEWNVGSVSEGYRITEGKYKFILESFYENTAGTSQGSANPTIGLTIGPPLRFVYGSEFNITSLPGDIRVGKAVKKTIENNGAIYLVGQNQLYWFPSAEIYLGWGFTWGDVVEANSAENQLRVNGQVPPKLHCHTTPLGQINGGPCLGSPPPLGLKDLASVKGLDIGTAVSWGYLNNALETKYKETLIREYNIIVPEVEGKMQYLQPTQGAFNSDGSFTGNFDFSLLDAIVNYAQANNLKVRGHTLVWGDQLAPWLAGGNFTSAQLRAILENHIKTVVNHYKGKIDAWDVVNEAISQPSIWQRIDPDNPTAYVDLAFQWAREADPNLKLYFNEYANQDSVLHFVRGMKTRGVPIDGVGMQMHLSPGNAPSFDAIKASMQSLKDLGLNVHITELDVRLPTNASGVASPQDLEQQAQVYRQVTLACAQSSNCKALLTWGFTDKYSWLGSSAPLPFDANYQPKPAYTALQNALR